MSSTLSYNQEQVLAIRMIAVHMSRIDRSAVTNWRYCLFRRRNSKNYNENCRVFSLRWHFLCPQSHATKLLPYILAGVFVTHHQQNQPLLQCHRFPQITRQFVQFHLDFDYYFSFESFRVLLNIPKRWLVITPSSRGTTTAIAAIARKNVSLLRVSHKEFVRIFMTEIAVNVFTRVSLLRPRFPMKWLRRCTPRPLFAVPEPE